VGVGVDVLLGYCCGFAIGGQVAVLVQVVRWGEQWEVERWAVRRG